MSYQKFRARLLSTAILIGLSCGVAGTASADILLKTDGRVMDGKIRSTTPSEVFFLPDRAELSKLEKVPRTAISKLVETDEHGAFVADRTGDGILAKPPTPHWTVPAEPSAPPVRPAPPGKSYYLIPLHGEVGETMLASALEKSLADAVARKPSVVVLDINSPGGSVEEAMKMVKILHRYNKQIRIVALTEQDLSASAIFSLSCKEIYVKSTSTIGAATAFIPGRSDLSAKVEEKMQSAWRAVARNSAEEGGHDPLLAEAMIDNDRELHLEAVNGKNVVKEGPGERMLCRKGKILTLTSHEAVACGLAAAGADDLAELGTNLGMAGWSEMKGLAGPMADYLPKRHEAFKSQAQKISTEMMQNLRRAIESDPSEQISHIVENRGIGPMTPSPIRSPMHMPPTLWPGMIPGIPNQGPRVVTIVSHTHWKSRSLACVLALQQCEQNISQLISLCDAFALESGKERLGETLNAMATSRARIYDDRNKYGTEDNADAGTTTVVTSIPPGQTTSTPPGVITIGSRQHNIYDDLPPNLTKTQLMGGPGGSAFVKLNPTGNPIVGFRYAFGDWGKPVMRQFDPLFDRTATPQSGTQQVIVAKEGYVVGGLLVEADAVTIVCVRVIFNRFSRGKVIASDAYQSDVLGTPAGGKMVQLAGKGELVVGTYGRYGLNMDGLGLITTASPAGTPSTMPTGQSAVAFDTNTPTAPGNDPIPVGAIQTAQLGGNGGSPFSHVGLNNAPVLGFRYTIGSWGGRSCVRRFDPIFDRPDPTSAPAGSQYVVAREGYAVAGLLIELDERNDLYSFQVVFARLKNGKLAMSDTYTSERIAETRKFPQQKLGLTGQNVIGTFGREGMNTDAIGLILAPAQ